MPEVAKDSRGCAEYGAADHGCAVFFFTATIMFPVALFFGWLFDRVGLAALILSTLCSAFFSCFIFLSGTPWMIGVGIILWGIGMGAQESIMKAAVSKIIPKSMRSSGFGIFETGFGIAWFLGSWLLGALYDVNPVYLVIVSVVTQMLAIVFYVICIRRSEGEKVS